MIDISQIDYGVLDRPEIIMFLFHPRPEWDETDAPATSQDVMIPVEEDVAIGGRFHMTGQASPNILFFHGNGEIVADYDQLGPLFNRLGINFLPVDYRGYGRSTGRPTVTAMMRDCHMIFEFVKQWLREKGYAGPFILMGRSLGSASVLELTAAYKDRIHGLIIESGFAYAGPLLRLLGVNVESFGFIEEHGFQNADKIKAFDGPVLIIHAEKDHIIPFEDGQVLYDSCRSADKTMLKIPGANHNDIFLRGFAEYMAAVKKLADKTVM